MERFTPGTDSLAHLAFAIRDEERSFYDIDRRRPNGFSESLDRRLATDLVCRKRKLETPTSCEAAFEATKSNSRSEFASKF